MIDERVCEACGDCGVQSNCLSLHSTETEFGRKTVVDQASCNVDASCLKGDCPAFITVVPGKAAKPRRAASPGGDIPKPMLGVPADVVIRMPGIGGTGVVTVSQVMAAAAQIAGIDAKTADQTGLSQKAGPVVSTVTIGDPTPGTGRGAVGLGRAGVVDTGQPRRARSREQRRRRFHEYRSDGPDDRQGRVARPRSRRRCEPSSPSAPTPIATSTWMPPTSSPRCWATPSPPTCSCSASPTRPGLSRCPVRRSSGPSSSTEPRSKQMSPPFVGAGGGRSMPTRSSSPQVPASPTTSRRTRSRDIDDAVLRQLAERRAGDLVDYQNRRYAARYAERCGRGAPRRAGRGRRWHVRGDRRPPAPSRHGLQGRVRGRPVATRRQAQGGGPVRRRRRDHLEPLSADVALDGPRSQAALRRSGPYRCWRRSPG